jgi:hypothetical protein
MRSTRYFLILGAVRRWVAPSALTNLDAQIVGSGARPEPIGAHAVEFSKTAAPLAEGIPPRERARDSSQAGNGV